MTSSRLFRQSRPRREVDPRRFRGALLAWYDRVRRDLPWRRTRDPYAIWVSETMLQQTRVEVVRPRWERFLARFPDSGALAAARVEEVLAAWSGLGYYSRARNLHRAARNLIREHEGRFPRDPVAAMALPGVGPYTARAVASIAYDVPAAAVDGNAARVLSRVSLLPVRPARIVQEEADRLLDTARPGDANQALMELGATVCLPARPKCADCPIAKICAARIEGRIESFPPPAERARIEAVRAVLWLVEDRRKRLWLEHRRVPPLRGLWMLPWRIGAGAGAAARPLGTIRHAITNRRYSCDLVGGAAGPREIPGPAAGPGRWVARAEIDRLPTSSLLRKALIVARRAQPS